MYRILDLFAGAGGLSLGFEMTKQFEIAAIVENNKNAAKTYIKNHPGLRNYQDILKVDFEKIIEEQGEIDVIIGGPPCQGFSNANRQRRKLINGSNELIKKYVKAIEIIKPRAFVMENVKMIMSDKHSFCLTHSDENYIKNILKLQVKSKDIVLYDGIYIKEVKQLCDKYNAQELSLLNEKELYWILNLYQKRKKLETYCSKPLNIKKINTIICHMNYKEGFPEWYNNSTERAKEILKEILNKKGNIDINLMDEIKNFWDIQRFYQGILELQNIDALFQIILSDKNIVVRMETYIVIEFVEEAFKKLGYEIKGDILNAASFGVPQNRERFIMIGIKKECVNKEVLLPVPIINDSARYITVKQAIGDLAEYAPTTSSMEQKQKKMEIPKAATYFEKLVLADCDMIFNHVCTQSRETIKRRFTKIKQGENFHSLPKELKSTYADPSRTQNTIYKRLAYNLPSDTVVNVRKSMWIHPELDRAVSAREAARLQSFPDDYVFYGTKDSVYQQIGNAVPPILGRAVAERVLELIGCKVKYETLKQIYDSVEI